MLVPVAVLLLSVSIRACAQQTVTLYEVSDTAVGLGPTLVIQESVTFEAAGIGTDGATTYREVVVESALGEGNPTMTSLTPFRTPVKATGNFIADASGYIIEVPFEGSMIVAASCRFGSDGSGTCVAELLAPLATTTTYSGPVVPFYTLITTPHSKGPPGTPGTSTCPCTCLVHRTRTPTTVLYQQHHIYLAHIYAVHKRELM
ncbi:hypothetical protein C8R44DRAFT_742657 [Mycena epipterygia]|nr:hypothetical protein C8R44DRAFT_742657 [Mycena epipterygia]